MLALLMLGISGGLCWLFYLKGYKQGQTIAREAGEKWAKEVVGESTDYLSQLIRQQVAGLKLTREEEIDLHDDIDDEIRAEIANEDYMGEYNYRVNLATAEPTQLSKIMKKGLANVNKRYGYKPKD